MEMLTILGFVTFATMAVFGAVDMIVTKSGKWYVLEANTACGLENTTLEKYVEQFKHLV